MLYDIGDVWSDGIYLYDDDDALANATSVVLTITLPDATTTTPTVTNVSTGYYTAEYIITQAGAHQAKWVATSVGAVSGKNTVDWTTFSVSSDGNTFISLADAKEYLNLSSDTADDDELLAYTETACELAEIVADRTFSRKTQVDTLSSTGDSTTLYLTRRPVISITSVTERGATLTAGTQYSHDPVYGHVYRMSSTYDRTYWAQGSRSNVVTYVAGYAIIPPTVRQATLAILKHLWDTQRNPAGASRPSARDDYAVPGTNWFIPNRARDVLADLRLPDIG